MKSAVLKRSRLLAQFNSISSDSSKSQPTNPLPKFPNEGIHAIFYEGLPYQGKPTKVFAYYGLPSQERNKAGQSARGCFSSRRRRHAFARWVKLWNDRGYAAIAMDLCGCVPVGTYGKWQRHLKVAAGLGRKF